MTLYISDRIYHKFYQDTKRSALEQWDIAKTTFENDRVQEQNELLILDEKIKEEFANL